MKESQLLFTGPMVRALLEGRKTQTRRLVKLQPHEECGPVEVGLYHPTVIDRHCDEQPGAEIFGAYSLDGEWGAKCPYGVIGDRLWVRETFSFVGGQGVWELSQAQSLGVERWLYRADGAAADRWWPSIHMPRAASRITLGVTGVRVERVQDINEADAMAEGFGEQEDAHEPCARDKFLSTFYDLNERAPRTENPWVWVIEFRRLEGKA